MIHRESAVVLNEVLMKWQRPNGGCDDYILYIRIHAYRDCGLIRGANYIAAFMTIQRTVNVIARHFSILGQPANYIFTVARARSELSPRSASRATGRRRRSPPAITSKDGIVGTSALSAGARNVPARNLDALICNRHCYTFDARKESSYRCVWMRRHRMQTSLGP